MNERRKSHIADYNEAISIDPIAEPLERLRFFCSLAMNGNDWLASEVFFDDLASKLDDAYMLADFNHSEWLKAINANVLLSEAYEDLKRDRDRLVKKLNAHK